MLDAPAPPFRTHEVWDVTSAPDGTIVAVGALGYGRRPINGAMRQAETFRFADASGPPEPVAPYPYGATIVPVLRSAVPAEAHAPAVRNRQVHLP